nr:leucine-rich repeat-containing protein [Tanacetum cinerariifolium]
TKDMLTSKWHTLNANCQKFNAAYKWAKRFGRSGENDVDVLKGAQSIYRDEHRGVAFCQEDAWAILKFHPKWDAPEQVDLTGDVPGATQEDLFEINEEPQHVPRQRANVSTPMVTSRVLEEEIASLVELEKAYMAFRPYKVAPVELEKAYMASRPYKVAQRQDLVLHNNATKIASKIANGFENRFTTPRSRGRSALYRMARPSYARSPLTFTQKAIRNLEKGDLPGLLSYPLNEAPLKLPAEPPHKKRAFRTSVPGSDSALAADIVATSTLSGVSRTPAVVEPPQKKCAFQMSAPEDDSFEIDDALAEPKALESTSVSDSVTTNGHAKLTKSNKVENKNDQKSTNISVEGNDQKSAKLTESRRDQQPTNIFGKSESKDGKGNDQKAANFSSPHVSSTSIASTKTTTTVISTTTTSTPATILSTSSPTPVIPLSVPAPVFSFRSDTSTTPTISEAKTGNTSVRNDKDLKSNSPFASTLISTTTTTTENGLFGFSSPVVTSTTNNQSQASFFNKRAYGFGTTYNDHTSTESMKEDSMQTLTPAFDMSVDSMMAEDTHVHGTDMSVDSMVAENTHVHGTDMGVDGMVAEDTHVHGTDMSVDSMVAKDTHVHGTDISVDGMVAEDTHVHGTGATLNNYDHTHMDMMVDDCMQTPTGETSVASPLFSLDSEDLPNLQVLVLKSNKFHGHIQPSSAVRFPFQNLQVLDLSHNRFVGHLPAKYFQYFNSMKNVVNSIPKQKYLYMGGKYYSFVVPVKGVDLDILRLFVNLTIIDQSNNYFDREIPNIIRNMSSLKVLNSSHNHLNSQIPYCLGNLFEIESLDLSWNQLTREIPGSLAGIKGLAVLRLSYNRLVGRIPDGTQFKTFDENSFQGNAGLCGYPLPKKCSEYT